MTKYIGDSVVVEFGTTDISGVYTSVEINEEAPEGARIDVSDKSSSTIETIEGLPGDAKTTVTISANDEVGGNTEVLGLAVNDQDTLLVYPEGKTSGKPYRTIENMRLSSRRHSGGYQSKVEWQLTFYAYETVTDTTYTT